MCTNSIMCVCSATTSFCNDPWGENHKTRNHFSGIYIVDKSPIFRIKFAGYSDPGSWW